MDFSVSTYRSQDGGQAEDPEDVAKHPKNHLLMKKILTGGSDTTVMLSYTLQIRTQFKCFAKLNTSNTSPMSPASLTPLSKNKYFSGPTRNRMYEIHGCDMKKLPPFRNSNFKEKCRINSGSCPYWRESWAPKMLKQRYGKEDDDDDTEGLWTPI